MSEPMTDLMTAIEAALTERTKILGSWIYDYPEAVDELVSALRPAVEQWERELSEKRSTIPDTPLDEAAERVRFEALVGRLRDMKTCDDEGEGDKCSFDSGPYCGRHDFADLYVPLMREAADTIADLAGLAAKRDERERR